ncbi:pentatricopeptide repeat domain-containing protein [Toxoplasma gondii ARI]|uniref:Pentatricopeptide repeat domain-containing protein n=1 Tax=Toxoplasma gondii ARI TaxID=1074872 RepID=A0A139YB92_TOXGO|nr:pentatricopeptide repeat domain-containing protein [Toxoplasma gondii ARI]
MPTSLSGGVFWSKLVQRTPAAAASTAPAASSEASPALKPAFLPADQAGRSTRASQSGALTAPHSSRKGASLTASTGGGRDQSFFWPVFGGSPLQISGVLIPYYICPLLPNFPNATFYSYDGCFEAGAEGRSKERTLANSPRQSLGFEDDACGSIASSHFWAPETVHPLGLADVTPRRAEVFQPGCPNGQLFGSEADLSRFAPVYHQAPLEGCARAPVFGVHAGQPEAALDSSAHSAALLANAAPAAREPEALGPKPETKRRLSPSFHGRRGSLTYFFHHCVPRRVQHLLQWSIPNFLVLFIFACVLPACLKYRAPIAIDFAIVGLFLSSVWGFIAIKSDAASKIARRSQEKDGPGEKELKLQEKKCRLRPCATPAVRVETVRKVGEKTERRNSPKKDVATLEATHETRTECLLVKPEKQTTAYQEASDQPAVDDDESKQVRSASDDLALSPTTNSVLDKDEQSPEEDGQTLSAPCASTLETSEAAVEEPASVEDEEPSPGCDSADPEIREPGSKQPGGSLPQDGQTERAVEQKIETFSSALVEREREDVTVTSCAGGETVANASQCPEDHSDLSLLNKEEDAANIATRLAETLQSLPAISECTESQTEDQDPESSGDASFVVEAESAARVAPEASAASQVVFAGEEVVDSLDSELAALAEISAEVEECGENAEEGEAEESCVLETDPSAEAREKELISDLASPFWASPPALTARQPRCTAKKAVSFSPWNEERPTEAGEATEAAREVELGLAAQSGSELGKSPEAERAGEEAEPDFGDGLQRSHRAALSPALALLYDEDVSVSEEILSCQSLTDVSLMSRSPSTCDGNERALSRPTASLDLRARGETFIAGLPETRDEVDVERDSSSSKRIATPMHIGVDVDEGGIAGNVKSFCSHASLASSFLLESEDDRSDQASGVNGCLEATFESEEPPLHTTFMAEQLRLPLAALTEGSELVAQEPEVEKVLWKVEDTQNTTAEDCAFSSVSSNASLFRSQSPETRIAGAPAPAPGAPSLCLPVAAFPGFAGTEAPFPFVASVPNGVRDSRLAFGVGSIERLLRVEDETKQSGPPGLRGFPAGHSETASEANFPFGRFISESLSFSPTVSFGSGPLGFQSAPACGLNIEELLDLDSLDAQDRDDVRQLKKQLGHESDDAAIPQAATPFVLPDDPAGSASRAGAPAFPPPPPLRAPRATAAPPENCRASSGPQRPHAASLRAPPPPVSPPQDEEAPPPATVTSQPNSSKQRIALQHYMALVRECHRTKDSRGAIRVLGRLQAEGRVAADTQLLNYVLMVCVSANDRVMTGQLFKFMETTGCADLVTYNTLVKSFTANGELHAAEQVLARMEGRENTLEAELSGAHLGMGFEGKSENGVLNRPKISPDEVTFNLLVNAAVSAGDPDKAWEYIDRIKKANLRPDKFTISSIIKSLQPGQNEQHTRRAFELMDQIDACEDLVLLSTCIDACARLGDLDRLATLLARFEDSDLKPNAHAYGTLIKAYGKLGNVTRVWELWMEQQRSGIEASNYTLGCMIDCLASNGLMNEAVDLFGKSVAAGSADAVLFSILVKGLARFRNRGLEVALGAYRRLKESDNSAAVTPASKPAAGSRAPTGGPSCGVDGSRESRRRGGSKRPVGGEKGDKAGAARDGDGEEHSCYLKALNTISFNSLLHLCVRSGRLADALELFKDMQSHPHAQPDLITYSTVIKGLCCSSKEHALDAALGLFEQMQKDAKISPDAIVYNTLIQGAATRRNVTLVESLLLHMLQNKVKPSSYTLCQCVKLYGKCGDLARALELALELPRRFNFAMDSYVYTALIAACTHNRAPFLAATLALQATQENQELPPALLLRLANHLQQQRELAEREAMNSSLRELPLLQNVCSSELNGKVLGPYGVRKLSPAEEAKATVDAIIKLLKRAVGSTGAPGAREDREGSGEALSFASFSSPGDSSQRDGGRGAFATSRTAAGSKRSKRGGGQSVVPVVDRERGERVEKATAFSGVNGKRKPGNKVQETRAAADDGGPPGLHAGATSRGFGGRQGGESGPKTFAGQRKQLVNAGTPPPPQTAFKKSSVHASRVGGLPRGSGGLESTNLYPFEDMGLNLDFDGPRMRGRHSSGASSAVTTASFSKETARSGRKGHANNGRGGRRS